MIKTIIASLLSSVTIGGSAAAVINVSPTYSVGAQLKNSKKNLGIDPYSNPYTHTYTKNNADLVVDGKSSATFFYGDASTRLYEAARWTLTLTSNGVQSLMDEYKADSSFWGTGTIIMDWFNHKIWSFDNLYQSSFLNIVEGHSSIVWNNTKFDNSNLSDVYLSFRDNLRQPADTIYKLAKMTGKLPEMTAIFGVANPPDLYAAKFTLL